MPSDGMYEGKTAQMRDFALPMWQAGASVSTKNRRPDWP